MRPWRHIAPSEEAAKEASDPELGAETLAENPAVYEAPEVIEKYLVGWLLEAYRRIRKDAAGVDCVTATDYEANLEGNLQTLLDRAKAGTYRAPPLRRAYIPKGDSATESRPIGIPTLERS